MYDPLSTPPQSLGGKNHIFLAPFKIDLSVEVLIQLENLTMRRLFDKVIEMSRQITNQKKHVTPALPPLFIR